MIVYSSNHRTKYMLCMDTVSFKLKPITHNQPEPFFVSAVIHKLWLFYNYIIIFIAKESRLW